MSDKVGNRTCLAMTLCMNTVIHQRFVLIQTEALHYGISVLVYIMHIPQSPTSL